MMGPTASGKTDLAEALATRLGAQLINADAFQAYRGMDIGTAKSDARERYALLDIKAPNESYGVGEFVGRAGTLLHDLYRDGRSAVVVGGTGLYVRALFEEYAEMAAAPDPALRARLNALLHESGLEPLLAELDRLAPGVALDRRNPARVIRAIERAEAPPPAPMAPLPPFRKVKLALVPPSDMTIERIGQRTIRMVQNGWVREVRSLRESGYVREDPGFRAIGYRQMWDHLDGQIDLDEAIATTIAETRRYAKRQRTWLRSEPNLSVFERDAARDAPLDWAWERIETALQ